MYFLFQVYSKTNLDRLVTWHVRHTGEESNPWTAALRHINGQRNNRERSRTTESLFQGITNCLAVRHVRKINCWNSFQLSQLPDGNSRTIWDRIRCILKKRWTSCYGTCQIRKKRKSCLERFRQHISRETKARYGTWWPRTTDEEETEACEVKWASSRHRIVDCLLSNMYI